MINFQFFYIFLCGQSEILLFYYLWFLKLTLLFSALCVVVSRNPVMSVIFLIYTFLNSALLLFFFGAEYFAMLLILVYLGAIAVLFLFVVMLLNIRIFEITQQTVKFTPFLLLAIVILCLILFLNFKTFLYQAEAVEPLALEEAIYLEASKPEWVNIYYSVSFIRSLAFVMFTYGAIYIVIISFILLLAVVGVISLTLVKSKKLKLQDDYSQVIRENRLNLVLQKR